MIGSRLCVPATEELKRKILEEAHSYTYSMHPIVPRCTVH